MNPGLIALLVGGLGTGLVEVFRSLLQEGVVKPALEHGLEPLRDLVGRGYDRAKDEAVLREALLAGLDELRADINVNDYDRFLATLKLTGKDANMHRLLAAAAVEMVQYDPGRLPEQLFKALSLDESKRDLLANFLFRFRKRLNLIEGYSAGIAFANHLEASGQLAGITQHIALLAEQTNVLVNINQALLKFRGLTLDEEKAAEAYLTDVRRTLIELPLPLARRRIAGPVSADIKRIYVPLTLRDLLAEAKARDRVGLSIQRKRGTLNEEQLEEIRPIGIGEALANYSCLALVGPPGSGKTTLLRRAALAFAEGRAVEDLLWKEALSLFPAYVRLRNFAAFLHGRQYDYSAPSHGALTAYLDHFFRTERNLDLTADFFERRLNEGNCLILLDGLDEVSDLRSEVAQQVCAFVRYYQSMGNRFALGSRPKGYESVEIYLRSASPAVIEVNPLAPEGIRKLISNLFEWIEPDHLQQRRDSLGLAEKILASDVMTELASTPMFCTSLVQVYKYHGADLPQRRVDVFQEIVDLLLGFWKAMEELARADELAKDDGTGKAYREVKAAVETKLGRLCHLAEAMQQAQKAELSKGEAVSLLANYLEQRERVKSEEQAFQWAENFLINSHERSGLLVEIEAGIYAFVHQYFREYLAATGLTNRREEDFIQTVLTHIEDDWWEEVILLAGAHERLPSALRQYMVNAILDASDESRQAGDVSSWMRYLHVAGRASADMAERLPGIEHERIEENLFQAMTNPVLAPKLRAEAGDLLDQLGWLPPDLYEFVPISGQDDSSPFWISKYPVTNAQYQHFVEAEDFADPGLWRGFPKFDDISLPMKSDCGEEGWEWLQINLGKDNKLVPRNWHDPRFGITCKGVPVVGITWYEANAYCRWLLRHWYDESGLPYRHANPKLEPGLIRLPTEAEWSLAAGGAQPEGRYPWDEPGNITQGVEEITCRANVREGGIGRTTPVGMYPLGVSQPYGLWDVAGNVWEWQANYYDYYQYRDRDFPALRGGSWVSYLDSTRVAVRFNLHPLDHGNFNGFRVMSLPR